MTDVRPAFVFLPEDDETPNDRVARCHEEFLSAGPLEWTNDRADDFKQILTDTWLAPIPWKQGGTTCALWQGTVLQAAQVQARRKVNPQYAITTWLKVNGFTEDKPETEYVEGSWIPVDKLRADGGPIRGDIPYWCGGGPSTWQAATNGHVANLLTGSGFDWLIAQGGGTNGRCKIASKPDSILTHLNRPLRGVWRPNLMVAK